MTLAERGARLAEAIVARHSIGDVPRTRGDEPALAADGARLAACSLRVRGLATNPVWRDDRSASLHRALMLIEEWRHASDSDRDVARREAQAACHYWRIYHRDPTRRAFAAAVAHSQSTRTTP